MAASKPDLESIAGVALVVLSVLIAVAYILFAAHPLWLMLLAILVCVLGVNLIGRQNTPGELSTT